MKLTALVLISIFSYSTWAADTVTLERTVETKGSEYALDSKTTCSIDTDSIDISMTSGDLGATSSSSKFNSFSDLSKVEALIDEAMSAQTLEIEFGPNQVSKTYTAKSSAGSVQLLKLDGEKGIVIKNVSEAAKKLRLNMDLLCN